MLSADEAQIAVYEITQTVLPELSLWPEVGVPPSQGWIAADTAPAELRIAPYDLLRLTVWDSETNSLLTTEAARAVAINDLRVSGEGTIFVPYLGDIPVAGQTQEAARRLIEQEMTAIVPSAQVQLVHEPGTRGSVALVGGVAQPGRYPLPEGRFSLLMLLSEGGGVRDSLRNPQVRLIRDGRTYLASLDRLLENPAEDTILRGGDKVAVIEDARFFRAIGASGQERLVPFGQDEVSALDAVAMISGVNDRRADPSGVLVLREYPPEAVRPDGQGGPRLPRVVFALDLTSADGLFSAGRFPIRDGDTVYVAESAFNATESILSLFGTTLAVGNRVSEVGQ